MYSPRRQRASLIVTIISVLAAVALIIAGEGTAPPALTGAGLVLCLIAFLFSIVAYWFFGPRFRKIGVDEDSQLSDARRMLGEPFQTSVKLAADEAILYSDVAQLVTTKYSVTLAQPDRFVSKTKGGVTGAVVGGLLLGPVGAVAGYATSGKTTTTTVIPGRKQEVTSAEELKAGLLTITNRRCVFQRLGPSLIFECYPTRTIAIDENAREIRVPYTVSQSHKFIVNNIAYLCLALESQQKVLPSDVYQKWARAGMKFDRREGNGSIATSQKRT